MTGEKRYWRDRIGELFRNYGSVEKGHAEAAMLFRYQHPGNSQVLDGAEHLVAKRIVTLGTFADMIERAGIRKTPRNGIAQHLLVLRKSEIH